MLRWRGWIAWTIVAYLLAAAVFELVFALRHTFSPDWEWVVWLVALIAMLVGARFYAGDPYDKPFFQSYAEGGSPAWIFALLVLSLLAAVTTLVWRRRAAVESVAVLVLLLFTAMFMGTH